MAYLILILVIIGMLGAVVGCRWYGESGIGGMVGGTPTAGRLDARLITSLIFCFLWTGGKNTNTQLVIYSHVSLWWTLHYNASVLGVPAPKRIAPQKCWVRILGWRSVLSRRWRFSKESRPRTLSKTPWCFVVVLYYVSTVSPANIAEWTRSCFYDLSFPHHLSVNDT